MISSSGGGVQLASGGWQVRLLRAAVLVVRLLLLRLQGKSSTVLFLTSLILVFLQQALCSQHITRIPIGFTGRWPAL